MSFITDIITYGLGQFGINAKGNTPSTIVTSALSEFVNQKITTAIKKTNAPIASFANTVGASLLEKNKIERVEKEVKIELKADTEASIPVAYGEAFLKPLLVDAQITNDNCTMWYAVAICETTGNLINGTASTISIEEIYWNGKKITVFQDGVTVAASWEGVGFTAKQDLSLSNKVKIYCYNAGSEAPTNIRPQGHAVQHGNAYDIMPGWTTSHQMSNLVFALIRVDYDGPNEVQGIGDLVFKVKNSITKPGDVLKDYMTNTVYGAAIPEGDIN